MPEDQSDAKLEPLTFEEYSRFAESKNIQNHCPVCGNSRLSFIASPEQQLWAMHTTNLKGEAIVSPTTIPIVMLACGNCFFIRTHAQKPIKSWALENPTTE